MLSAPGQVFSEPPQTRKAAILTGCKNISGVEILESGQVWATDWDLPLEVCSIEKDITAIGIRMHDIRPGCGKNAYHCSVVEEIENPFSYTIMLQPVNTHGAARIGWEIEKEYWQKNRAEEVSISLPPESLLLLKD